MRLSFFYFFAFCLCRTKHIKTVHDGLRPYSCTQCDATYGHLNLLNEHVSTSHLGQRPFVCPICGASFGRKSNLYQHDVLTQYVRSFVRLSYCAAPKLLITLTTRFLLPPHHLLLFLSTPTQQAASRVQMRDMQSGLRPKRKSQQAHSRRPQQGAPLPVRYMLIVLRPQVRPQAPPRLSPPACPAAAARPTKDVAESPTATTTGCPGSLGRPRAQPDIKGIDCQPFPALDLLFGGSQARRRAVPGTAQKLPVYCAVGHLRLCAQAPSRSPIFFGRRRLAYVDRWLLPSSSRARHDTVEPGGRCNDSCSTFDVRRSE